MNNQPDGTCYAPSISKKKFLALSLESTRKSYYPQLLKQLEAARENEKRLQLLIDNMPAQIAYIDAARCFVLVNSQFENAFHLKRDDIIGIQMADIVAPSIYNQISPYIDRALSGQSGHVEIDIDMPETGRHWYDIHYVPEISDDNIVNGFYALILDQTGQKRAREEQSKLKDRLRQSQKMEAIGTLSGGIAHDFNNILSGIFGYSELAAAFINDPEKSKEYIDKIMKSAKRASSLIQQILTFSRQSKARKQPVDLSRLLKDALKLIRSTIPTSIEIRNHINAQPMILGDSTQIHQVIMNLCTNAYHAMADEGGVLTVGLEEVQLPENTLPLELHSAGNRFARLEIADTGPGIPLEIKDKIFDPYFTTKDIGKGTGLGLALVDGIIKKHQGLIHLRSEPDQGACFLIFLPVIKKEAQPSQSESVKQPDAVGSETIMLVDDEIEILGTLDALLTGRGYQVAAFDSSQSALDAFKKDPDAYDVVITDMTMPKMTGDKLSQQLLEIKKTVPIIICSGYHESINQEQAQALGIRKFVEKPVLGSELAQLVRELLDGTPDWARVNILLALKTLFQER